MTHATYRRIVAVLLFACGSAVARAAGPALPPTTAPATGPAAGVIPANLPRSPGTGAGEFFTIAVMPDTQYYTLDRARTETYFKGQTRWIAANRRAGHIVFVSQLGDLQQDGTYLRTDGNYRDPEAKELIHAANPTSPPQNDLQWERASDAMRLLDDAGVPYVAVAGNHDFMHWGLIRDPYKYLKYFGPGRFDGKPWFGGYSPPSAKMPAGINNFQLFRAGGLTFLSLGLRYAPDAEDLAWAQRVVDAYPGLPTIVTTHAYLTNHGFDKDRRNIWEQLVRRNRQVFLTLNGHVSGHNVVVEPDDAGLAVVEILVDYQDLKVPGFADGGAFLRTLRFAADLRRIEVRSYSPVVGRYLEGPKDQFTIACDLRARFAGTPAAATTQLLGPAAPGQANAR